MHGPDMAPAESLSPVVAAAALPKLVTEGVAEDIWVELPAEAEVSARKRPPRGRGRKKEESAVKSPTTENVMETIVVEPPPALARDPVTLPAVEPLEQSVVVLATASETPAPREPDPAEIQAPPSIPRRGWWRRGA
jgi:hypothetical protein